MHIKIEDDTEQEAPLGPQDQSRGYQDELKLIRLILIKKYKLLP